jgi:hypothetical protein
VSTIHSSPESRFQQEKLFLKTYIAFIPILTSKNIAIAIINALIKYIFSGNLRQLFNVAGQQEATKKAVTASIFKLNTWLAYSG